MIRAELRVSRRRGHRDKRQGDNHACFASRSILQKGALSAHERHPCDTCLGLDRAPAIRRTRRRTDCSQRAARASRGPPLHHRDDVSGRMVNCRRTLLGLECDAFSPPASLLGTLPVAACAQNAQVQAAASTPSLLVFITVDQMRPDYFSRFEPQLTGGLARLYKGGAFFTNAFQDHAITETAPGHSVTMSGRFPRSTGHRAEHGGSRRSEDATHRRWCARARRRGDFAERSLIDWLTKQGPALARAVRLAKGSRRHPSVGPRQAIGVLVPGHGQLLDEQLLRGHAADVGAAVQRATDSRSSTPESRGRSCSTRASTPSRTACRRRMPGGAG